MTFIPPAPALQELKSLFTKSVSVLTNEEANEKDYFERCKILYRDLGKLDDDRRGQIVSCIKRYDTISASTIESAEFVINLASDLIPKLAKLRNYEVLGSASDIPGTLTRLGLIWDVKSDSPTS